jgi:hypothetical protein
MNRITAIALFVGAALMTANSATAQSSVVKVNVPFAFTVNNTFLPAGSYLVGFDSANPELLVIRDRTNAVSSPHPHRAGLSYPLRNLSSGPEKYGRGLLMILSSTFKIARDAS